MNSQIPGGTEGLNQLVCDSKTQRGSAIETEDGNHRFVAEDTVYARALGVVLAQTTYDTHESSEKAALKELLSTLDLNGVLIQTDTHCTRHRYLSLVPETESRPLVDRQIQPKVPEPADRLPVRGKAQDPFQSKGCREAARTPGTLATQGQKGTRAHQGELAMQRLDRGGDHQHHDYVKGKRDIACHRLITSLRTTREALLRLIRQRRSIENEWHWVCDTQLCEDADRYANRTGVGVFSFLRTVVMNLLRRRGYRSIRQSFHELTYDIKGMLALGGMTAKQGRI